MFIIEWIIVLLVFSFISLIVWMIYLAPSKRCHLLNIEGIVSAPRNFPYGQLPEIKKNRAKGVGFTSLRFCKEYGKVHVFFAGPFERLGVADPKFVKAILVTNASSYTKTKNVNAIFEFICGPGMFTNEGELHKRERKLCSPWFHYENLVKMLPIFVSCCEKMCNEWDKKNCIEVDIHKEFMHLTIDVISCSAFGYDVITSSEKTHPIADAVQEVFVGLQKFIFMSSIPWFSSILRVFYPKDFTRMSQSSLVINNAIEDHYLKRKTDNKEDLFKSLIHATNNGKANPWSMKQLKGNAATFLIAGHETTASMLSWAIYLLMENPEWIRILREETQNVCGSATPSVHQLKNLEKHYWFILETLRLYPPAGNITRYCTKDNMVEGIKIPSGANIIMYTFLMHRDPDLWEEDPSIFNPYRFRRGIAKAVKHSMAYLPFGIGPRNCIGQKFAIMEAQIVLALLLRRYDIYLSPGCDVKPVVSITVKPRNGVLVRLTKRE